MLSLPLHRKRRLLPLQETSNTEPDVAQADESLVDNDHNYKSESRHSNTSDSSLSSLIMKVDQCVLRHEIQELKKENIELEKQIKYAKMHFTYAAVKSNDSLVNHYTGLPSAEEFDGLLELCRRFDYNYYYGWRVETLSDEDQLFLTLMKLRSNFTVTDLAVRFSVSVASISNITMTWISILYEVLYMGMMRNAKIPSVLKNKGSLPSCFSTFSGCRMILDCTEIQCAIPGNMEAQRSTFSHYKQRNTFKALVGVAPNGVITYVSDLYPGSVSDKEIVRHCGVLNHFEAGDLIIADKGFLIQDLLPSGVLLNIPPFLTHGQFTKAQASVTVVIARARIHVERAIQRMKTFGILDFFPHQYRSVASKIFKVVACLVGLQNPLIKEIESKD